MVTINISERPPPSPAPPFLDRKLVSLPHAGYVFFFSFSSPKIGPDNDHRLVCCVVLSRSRRFRFVALVSPHLTTYTSTKTCMPSAHHAYATTTRRLYAPCFFMILTQTLSESKVYYTNSISNFFPLLSVLLLSLWRRANSTQNSFQRFILLFLPSLLLPLGHHHPLLLLAHWYRRQRSFFDLPPKSSVKQLINLILKLPFPLLRLVFSCLLLCIYLFDLWGRRQGRILFLRLCVPPFFRPALEEVEVQIPRKEFPVKRCCEGLVVGYQ